MITDTDRLNLLLDLRRYADAEKAAREAIGRDPQWAPGYAHLARALMGLNKKEAIDAAREGARKAPHDAWVVGTLACALSWFGQMQEALEAVEETIRLDPHYAWAYAMHANILYNLNRFGEARAKAVQGLRFDPLSEILFRWKGWAEHKMGEQADALRTAQDALKHHPNSHLLLNLVGCVKWTQAEKTWGRERLRLHREADTNLRKSIRIDPTQSAYHDNLRGNAVSCRVHLLSIAVPVTFFAVTVLPLLVFAIGVMRHVNYDKAVETPLGAIALSGLVAAVAVSNTCALALPLGRFRVPTVPITSRERWLARLELSGYGLLVLAAYGFAVFVYFR